MRTISFEVTDQEYERIQRLAPLMDIPGYVKRIVFERLGWRR